MSSRSSRPSSARPAAAKRASVSRRNDDDLDYECKAAWLTTFDDLQDDITSQHQLFQLLQQTGRNPTKRALSKHWTSRTESMSFSDFVNVCRDIQPTSEDELLRAFKKIDLNGDGYLSNSELRKVLTTKGEKMTKEEVQEIIDEVDENRDGRLDYNEFCKMMISTQEECRRLSMQQMEKKTKKSKSHKDSASYSTNGREDSDFGSQATLKSDESAGREKAEDTNPVSDEEIPEEISNYDGESDKSDGEAPQNKPDDTDRKLHRGSIMGSSTSLRSELAADSTSKYDDILRKKVQPPKPHRHRSSHNRQRDSSSSHKSKTKDDNDDDEDDSDGIVIGTSRSSVVSSTSTLKDSPPKPRPRNQYRATADEPQVAQDTKASARDRDRCKSPLAGKDLKLPKPKRLKDWKMSHTKGCFFFEEEDDSISSHQYSLKLSRDSSVYISMEPFSLRPGSDLNSSREVAHAPVDTALMVLREDDSLVAMTEHRDLKGRYALKCDLEKGRYKLIPFTSGCRFKRRTREAPSPVKLVREKDGKFTLTKDFREALSDIFEMCDLDGNGRLSRSEFGWFNLRTSGEELQDGEWEVVEENFELQDGDLTRQGFISLNQMEAEDSQGDTEDLWVTMSSMGYSKSLNLDEACPFFMEVYTETGEGHIKVTGIEAASAVLDRAMTSYVMGKGEATKIKQMKDLFLHTFINDFRAAMVIENKSNSRVKLSIDCSKSKNCATNHDEPEHTVTVPSRSTAVVHHLMPKKETAEWSISWRETVIK